LLRRDHRLCRKPRARTPTPPALTFTCLVLAGMIYGTASPAIEIAAGRITPENVAARQVGGPDAVAGIDDWFLSNGTLCAAFSDPAHEGPLSPAGGVLVDLGHCGANDDQFVVLQPMLNLSQNALVPVSEIETGTGPGLAWLRTRALFEGVEILTTYRLGRDHPTRLAISIRGRRIQPGARLFALGQLLLHPDGQTPVFSLLRSDPDRSVGFVYPETDRRSVTSLLDALIATDLTVLVGADEMPPISYGLDRSSVRVEEAGRSADLGTFSVSGSHFTFVSSLSRPPWIGSTDRPPGLLQLAQIPFMDVEANEVLALDYDLHVGDRADVASITDRVWSEAALVRGHVDDADARIHIERASGSPMTQIRPDADGRFSLRLPTGPYRLVAMAAAGRRVEQTFEVVEGAESLSLPPTRVGAPGWVRLPRDFVGRLSFLPEDGSPAIVFGDDLLGQRMGPAAVPSGTEAPWLNLAASPIDPKRVPLPPGRYRVLAVRGPEYEARVQTLEARVGAETPLDLPPLARVAPTPGWIGADYHVHTGASFDSSVPPIRQLTAFAASGAELLVATEHDRIVDPRPAIERAGLTGRLLSVTGVEATSAYEGGDSPYASGHLNAFPLQSTPERYRGGAPAFEGRRLRDVLADLHARPERPFLQMNHPRPVRLGDEGDHYFTHLGVVGEPFEPNRLLSEEPNAALIAPSPRHGVRDLDFDGLELLNGENLPRYRRVRADWLSLLRQGERKVATANSDSHRLGVVVGLPRTYVAQAQDTLADFDEAAHLEALRAGQAWGTTGPLLDLRLGEVGIGGLYPGAQGTLELKVDAAPWVPISEWRAYVDGELVHRGAIGRGEQASLPLVFARDAFVTVEIEGPAEDLYAEALPGFVPFAFTNPIFVDADGDGHFTAPGLVAPLPGTIRDPERPDQERLDLSGAGARTTP